jgi:hypothetical protein
MTESARDEALRLAREAELEEVFHAWQSNFVRLIALARQRPGWVWLPEEVVARLAKPREGT